MSAREVSSTGCFTTLPRSIGGVDLFDKRSQPCPHASDILRRDTSSHTGIERTQHIVNVIFGALRIINWALIVGVGGSDIGMGESAVRFGSPRDNKQTALIFGHGNDHSNIVANFLPRHSDVHTFGWPNRVRVDSIFKSPYSVGPHAGGVNHNMGLHIN